MNKLIKNKIYIFFKLLIQKNSLLRTLQILECLNLSLRGKSIEFGAFKNKKKNFSYFIKKKQFFQYSNIFTDKKNNIIFNDLTKKLKIKNNSYNNVLLFNVLEHLPDFKLTFKEINRIMKKNSYFIGSVPFLYQIHGAPKDYFRFTSQFFEFYFKKNNFKIKKIKSLGFGPFIACYSLIYPYISLIPFLKIIFLLVAILLDSFIQLFVKTDLKTIFPVGIFFIVKK